MATNKSVPSGVYPVWVGNLHESVTENVLKQLFSGFGSMKSCAIMKDSKGKTKNFGYVNFTVKSVAENAARKLNGHEIRGKIIKTKGPAVLRKEGYLKMTRNYRPLTDCTFFVLGKGCAKGDECPYRHSERARQHDVVCSSWLNRSCVKKNCPKRHPRLTNNTLADSESDSVVEGSDSRLSFTYSDSDESMDYSQGDSSSISHSPSPLMRRWNKTSHSDIQETKYSGSTQPFTLSSDDDDELGGSNFRLETDSYESSDDEDYFEKEQSPLSLTRLTSLTASDVKECIEEGEEVGRRGSKNELKQQEGGRSQNARAFPAPLEPVGLFWDIENCQVPLDKSAFSLANKMRKVFFKGKREAEFMCVCDITKERKEVTDDLHNAHVTLVHVNAIAKNAADDKLKHSIRRFAHTFPPPATVVLVSGDVNFSFELNDLRHVHNMTTILVHNAYTSEALKVCAHTTILFEDFLLDVAQQHKMATPTPTVLVVKSLPSGDPWKIKNRLSRLADNCGGKVLHVDSSSRSARILFRTKEYAIKAQKRMSGEDVYGSKIKLHLEPPSSHHANVPPHHANVPPHHANVPPRNQFPPSHMPRPPLFGHPPPPRPPFMGGPVPPNYYHQQRPPMRFNPPPPHMLTPHPPSPTDNNKPIFRFSIRGLPVSDEAEFDNLTAIFTELRLSVNIKATLPEFYWESFSTACLTAAFTVVPSAELRNYQPVLQTIRMRALLPIEVVGEFFKICLRDMNVECKGRGVPWEVVPCQWSPEETEGNRVLSNVVSLLKTHERHWAKFEKFKNTYAQTYKTAISEMTVQHSCSKVIQLLSASKSDTVIMFTEFSPLNRIKKTDEFLKNSLSLLQSLPENKIKLIEFVEAYQKQFGKLAFASGRKGSDLQEIFSSSDRFFVSGIKLSSLLVNLKTEGSTSPLVSHIQQNIGILSNEFVQLLKDMPGQQLALIRLQQEYQTKYHRSFRVSDILPGASGMKALVDACQGIKCVPVPYGKRKDVIVVLSDHQPSPGPATKHSNPSPFFDDKTKQQQNVSEASASSTNPLELFKRDMVELLNALPNKKLYLNHIPEEYTKHFGKPYVLANYGGKKTVSLMKSIPDVIMIDTEGDERVVRLIPVMEDNSDNVQCEQSSNIMTKEECERRVEELLYSLPNHHTTMDKFTCDYENYFKEKLTNYYGHSKLLLLLQEMKATVVITGTGARRPISLVPLRVFALRMKELLSANPQGMKLSAVVPEYNKMFQPQFRAEVYGKTKLLPVVESIPDVVKITGEGACRVVSLATLPSPLLPRPSPLPPRPSPLPSRPSSGACHQVFLDEITSLLWSRTDNKLSLESLSTHYYTTFKKQINLTQLGYDSLLEAVSNLSNIKVSGKGASAIIQLVPEQANEVAVQRRPSQESVKGDKHIPNVPKLSVTPSSSPVPKPRTNPPDQPIPLPRLRLCETICVRLLSELHRILLCHPEHSMTLEELCISFKDSEEPSEPKADDLLGAIDKYAGKKSQYKFNVYRMMEDVVFVSLTHADALWKLSKDLQYLFVYAPTRDYTMSLDNLVELYKTCHGHRLNPMVYKCESVNQLMNSKHLKQLIQYDDDTKTVSLHLKARREVFCQLACELLFRDETNCGDVDQFIACFETYFKTVLSLPQLQANSIHDLIATQEVVDFVEVDGTDITLTARGLYCEQLRHLLTVHNGQIPQGLLLTMYLSEFRHPQDSEILSWLHKKPIRYASHVVHLAAEFYIVWAPTGHPYPDTRAEKQSKILPEERSVTISELVDVPDLMASVINDPLPPNEIQLELDSEFFSDMPQLIDEFKGHVKTSDSAEVGNPPVSNLSDNDVIKGLDHGEFAGLNHQTVVEQMQEEMKGDEDSTVKLKKLELYIDYFGELADLELKRVEGPPIPKPRKSKSKTRLAIQFPGASSQNDTREMEESRSSPKSSPTLGDRKDGDTLDCLPQSDTDDVLIKGRFDWEKQQVAPKSGVNDDYHKEGSGAQTEWPFL